MKQILKIIIIASLLTPVAACKETKSVERLIEKTLNN
jgi:hypothetical protein